MADKDVFHPKIVCVNIVLITAFCHLYKAGNAKQINFADCVVGNPNIAERGVRTNFRANDIVDDSASKSVIPIVGAIYVMYIAVLDINMIENAVVIIIEKIAIGDNQNAIPCFGLTRPTVVTLRAGKVDVNIEVIIVCDFKIANFPIFLVAQVNSTRVVHATINAHTIDDRQCITAVFVDLDRRICGSGAFWP